MKNEERVLKVVPITKFIEEEQPKMNNAEAIYRLIDKSIRYEFEFTIDYFDGEYSVAVSDGEDHYNTEGYESFAEAVGHALDYMEDGFAWKEKRRERMRIEYLHQSQLDALIALTETCSHFMALFNQNAEQDKLAYTLKRMGDDLVRCANEGISTVEYKTRREKEAKDSEPASDGVLPEQG